MEAEMMLTSLGLWVVGVGEGHQGVFIPKAWGVMGGFQEPLGDLNGGKVSAGWTGASGGVGTW